MHPGASVTNTVHTHPGASITNTSAEKADYTVALMLLTGSFVDYYPVPVMMG